MVEAEITDGYRIAELLASEIDGRRTGPLGDLAVVDPDRSVSGTPAGERAYDVRRVTGDRDPRREPTPAEVGDHFARVLVHESGCSVELYRGQAAARDRAAAVDLPVRDDRGEPDPAAATDALVLAVETGARTKRAVDVLEAASEAIE